MSEIKGMKPIWYFVGLALLVIGGLVFVAGIYFLFNEAPNPTVLDHLHPDIWWGAFMMVVGTIFIWKNKDVIVE